MNWIFPIVLGVVYLVLLIAILWHAGSNTIPKKNLQAINYRVIPNGAIPPNSVIPPNGAIPPNSADFNRDAQFNSNFMKLNEMMHENESLYFGDACNGQCPALQDAVCDVFCNFGEVVHPQSTALGQDFVQQYGSSWKEGVKNTVCGGKGLSKTNQTLQNLESFCNACNKSVSPSFPSLYTSSKSSSDCVVR